MNLLGNNNSISMKLDSPIFYAGEDVTGTLILDLKSKINILTLQLYVFGKEKIWITLGQGDNKRHEKRVVNFLEQTVHLLDTEPEGKKKPPKTTIPPGHYEYSFVCTIPEDCPLPPSIEIGQSGIFYGIWGHVEDSSTWSANKGKNKKRKKSSQVKESFVPFTMVGKFLPQMPVPKQVNFTMVKKFMLSSKALEMNVKIKRDIFEPGESIKILFSVQNDSNKQVKRVETMIMPHWYQQLSKSKEFNSRMPPMFQVKWPDSTIEAETTRQLKLDVDLSEQIFPTIETASILRYHHVVMLRVFVKGESFIEIGVPITIQCKGSSHNVIDLEPIGEFTDDDLQVFSNPDSQSSGGCCSVM